MARLVKLEPKQCERSILNARVKTHTRQVFEELAARFAIHYAWGIGATGDHAAGRALDLMAYDLLPGPTGGFKYNAQGEVIAGPIRKGWNRKLADYVWAHRARLGLDYEIWDQVGRSVNVGGSLYDPEGDPRAYSGDSHANHVHLSFKANPPAYRPPQSDPLPIPKDDDMPTPADLWNERLNPGPTADAVGEYPPDATYPARDFLIGADAKLRRLERTVAAQYEALLGNVQQEDPRWADLDARVAGLDAKLDQVLAVLGDLTREGDES